MVSFALSVAWSSWHSIFPDGPSINMIFSIAIERSYYSGKCDQGHLDIYLKTRIFDSANRSDK